MKLTDELQRAVDAACGVEVTADTARRVLALLDLTSLNDGDTKESVKALCARALTPAGPVAAVCVWPRFVKTARAALKGSPVKIATVSISPPVTAPPRGPRRKPARPSPTGRTRSTWFFPTAPSSTGSAPAR